MSDLLPGLIKKIQELQKYVDDQKNDRKAIQGQIIKVLQWLAWDRSLIQHRCSQAFLTFLYNSYGSNIIENENGEEIKEYESRDDFIAWLKCKLKFAKIKITNATIKGEKVEFRKYMPFSLSFGKCSQAQHNDFFNKVQEFARVKWKCEFNDWFKEWERNEHLIQ